MSWRSGELRAKARLNRVELSEREACWRRSMLESHSLLAAKARRNACRGLAPESPLLTAKKAPVADKNSAVPSEKVPCYLSVIST